MQLRMHDHRTCLEASLSDAALQQLQQRLGARLSLQLLRR